MTRLRPPTGVASRRVPVLRGRGGRSVTRGTGQGAAELHPDAGLELDVLALVIPVMVRLARRSFLLY